MSGSRESRAGSTGTDSNRVGELFAAALETPAEERKALLEASAVDSPEVVAEVESLLSAHEQSGILGADLDSAKAVRLLEDAALESLPQEIGPYEIVRELGRGGMGVVYLAERAEGGFEQRVALKLVKRGMDSEAIVARFRQERQILARLEHPGIARLVDGGLTEEGQPYFAMEYVDAETINSYSARASLGLEGRLSLFGSVCDAVQYAHGRLVVHRDLKPSNVLVTAEGAVKLVDFGIAKLLDTGSGDAGPTALTSLGGRPLTPQYASPEQIRGEAITVASDVYALGVLLYELLVGRSPYPVPLTTPEEIERAVCETEPLAPSAAIRAQRVEGASQSQSRFAKRIRGDLDRVVLKALAKEAEHRYQSVEALVEDLSRFRDGMPIRARRAGWLYRAGKFMRRHRVGVAASTAALLALVVGLAATIWQRDRARLESEKLQVTQEYLISLFDAATPPEALGEEITAKELVARGVARLDEELDEEPEVRLEMLEALGRVSEEIGEFDQAERLLQETVKLAKELHGDKHVAVAEALVLIGDLHNRKGAWAESEAVLREALSLYDQLGAGDSAIALAAIEDLSDSLMNQGDYEDAVAHKRQGVERARQIFGDRSEEVANLLNGLGNALTRLDDYTGSENALRESLDIFRHLYGADHPNIATMLVNLGGPVFHKGDWQEAERYTREGIAMERRLRGNDHPRLAIKLASLSRIVHSLGRYEEAVTIRREALASLRDNMGESSPYYADTLGNLASSLAEQSRFEEAMPLFPQAEQLLLKAVGPEHRYYCRNLRQHAVALHLQGLDAPALQLIERAIPISQIERNRANMLSDRGSIRLALGATEDAETDFREALRTQRQTLSSNHPHLVISMSGLGWTLIAEKKPSEAAEVLREAVALADAALPQEHWRRAEARGALGAALVELGQRAEGEPLLREAHQQLVASRGADHPAARRAARFLG